MLHKKRNKKRKSGKEEPKGPPPTSVPRKPREHVGAYVRRNYRYQKRLARGKRFRIPWGMIIVAVIAFVILYGFFGIGH